MLEVSSVCTPLERPDPCGLSLWEFRDGFEGRGGSGAAQLGLTSPSSGSDWRLSGSSPLESLRLLWVLTASSRGFFSNGLLVTQVATFPNFDSDRNCLPRLTRGTSSSESSSEAVTRVACLPCRTLSLSSPDVSLPAARMRLGSALDETFFFPTEKKVAALTVLPENMSL